MYKHRFDTVTFLEQTAMEIFPPSHADLSIEHLTLEEIQVSPLQVINKILDAGYSISTSNAKPFPAYTDEPGTHDHCARHCQHNTCRKLRRGLRKARQPYPECQCKNLFDTTSTNSTVQAPKRLAGGIMLTDDMLEEAHHVRRTFDEKKDIAIHLTDITTILAALRQHHYQVSLSSSPAKNTARDKYFRSTLFHNLSAYFRTTIPSHPHPRITTAAQLKLEVMAYINIALFEVGGVWFPDDVPDNKVVRKRGFASGWTKGEGKELWEAWGVVVDELVALCVWRHVDIQEEEKMDPVEGEVEKQSLKSEPECSDSVGFM